MVGYDGPIYMTHPTKAICPILLVNKYFEKETGQTGKFRKYASTSKYIEAALLRSWITVEVVHRQATQQTK
jgi:predicted metal-dependent RNase